MHRLNSLLDIYIIKDKDTTIVLGGKQGGKKNILVSTGRSRRDGNSDRMADEGMKIFDGIIATYRKIAHYMKWDDKGVLAVPKINEKGDIEATDTLVKAEEYGKSL